MLTLVNITFSSFFETTIYTVSGVPHHLIYLIIALYRFVKLSSTYLFSPGLCTCLIRSEQYNKNSRDMLGLLVMKAQAV